MHEDEPRAAFTSMERSTGEDWAIISMSFVPFAQKLPDRILAHLRLLDGDYGGFAVDRLTHSLQTATLAHRAGEDEEYVVCALLHDIGDTLGSFNHPDIAAAILKPFVSEANVWMVEHATRQLTSERHEAPGDDRPVLGRAPIHRSEARALAVGRLDLAHAVAHGSLRRESARHA